MLDWKLNVQKAESSFLHCNPSLGLRTLGLHTLCLRMLGLAPVLVLVPVQKKQLIRVI